MDQFIRTLNKELPFKEKCASCIFPDERSCLRLFGAILQGYSEDWTSGRIYISEPLDKVAELKVKAPEFLQDAKKKSKYILLRSKTCSDNNAFMSAQQLISRDSWWNPYPGDEAGYGNRELSNPTTRKATV